MSTVANILAAFSKETGLASTAPAVAPAPVALPKKTLRERVEEVLALDKQFRHEGVTGDLWALEDVAGETFAADGSVPTLTQRGVKLVREKTLAGYRAIASKSILSALEGFDMSGMVVAGGAVTAALTGGAAADVDVFIYGLKREDKIKKINALAEHLHRKWSFVENAHAFSMGQITGQTVVKRVEVYNNRRCITFVSPKRTDLKIQVILRDYATISEIIHGFDLGSAAVADDGKRLYFTSLARFAFETGHNILDLSRRRPSYEYRIHKYLHKGFGLIVPNLDLEKLEKDDYANMSSLRINRQGHKSNNGWLTAYINFEPTGAAKKKLPALVGAKPASAVGAAAAAVSAVPAEEKKHDAPEEDLSIYGEVPYGNAKSLGLKNFLAATRDKVIPTTLCAHAEFAPGMNVCELPITFPGLADELKMLTVKRNYHQLAKIIGKEATVALATATMFDAYAFNYKELADGLVKAVQPRIAGGAPLVFPNVKDGTALQMFPSTVCTEQEWYGEFYKAPAAMAPMPVAAM